MLTPRPLTPPTALLFRYPSTTHTHTHTASCPSVPVCNSGERPGGAEGLGAPAVSGLLRRTKFMNFSVPIIETAGVPRAAGQDAPNGIGVDERNTR